MTSDPHGRNTGAESMIDALGASEFAAGLARLMVAPVYAGSVRRVSGAKPQTERRPRPVVLPTLQRLEAYSGATSEEVGVVRGVALNSPILRQLAESGSVQAALLSKILPKTPIQLTIHTGGAMGKTPGA